MSPNEILTLIIAGLSLALSVLVAIYQIRKDANRIKLDLVIHLGMVDKVEVEKKVSEGYFAKAIVKVTNIGNKPINITSVGFKANDGSSTTANSEIDWLPTFLKSGEDLAVDFYEIDLFMFLYEIAETNVTFVQSVNKVL